MSFQDTKETSNPALRPRARVTSAPGKLYEPSALPLLVQAFEMDPIMTYFLNKLPKASRPRALNKLLHLMMTSAILSNATFYESGTLDGGLEETATPLFQCAAVVLPPGKQVTEFGIGGWIKLVSQGMLGLIWKAGIRGLMKVLVEYPTLAEKIKKTVLLENEPYYYLLIIGTGSNHRGKGLAAAVIRKHQVIAQKKGLPMYLEGSNEGAAKVYEKCGFEHVKEPEGVELVVGKGKCDANGEKASGTGAVGVRIYPMIWWPEGYARGKVIQDKLAV